MNWGLLHPEALGLLALGPVLVALHLVRRRPATRPVPFLALWERAEPRRGGGFKRLRDLLALLLSLLLLALFALALARPHRPPPPPVHVLVLVDDSASMAAADRDGRSRLDAGRAVLAACIEKAPARVRFALFTLAGGARLVVPFDAGRGNVLAALASLEPKPWPGDTATALLDVSPLAEGRENGTIWLLSDTPPDRVGTRTPGGAPLAQVAVGDRADNVCIAEFSGAWGGWWDPEASFFVRALNPGSEPAAARLTVKAGDREVFGRDLRLPAGGDFESVFSFERRTTETMMIAEVVPGGALSLDDRAWCRVAPRRRRRILLVTDAPSAFSRSALQGLGALMDPERSGIVGAEEWARALAADDLAVFESTGPGEAFPAGGCLVLGAPPETLPAPRPGADAGPGSVVAWDEAHPVTQGLSFDGIWFDAVLPLPEDYHPLVTTERGVVAGCREGAGGRAVVLSPPLAGSNFGLVSSFPLFVRNALRWAGGDDEPGSCPSVAPGCRRAPDGYSIEWRAGPPGGPGVALVRREGQTGLLAVNFFDAAESALAAPAGPVLDRFPLPADAPPAADPWPWLLVAALGVLVLDGLLALTGRGAGPAA